MFFLFWSWNFNCWSFISFCFWMEGSRFKLILGDFLPKLNGFSVCNLNDIFHTLPLVLYISIQEGFKVWIFFRRWCFGCKISLWVPQLHASGACFVAFVDMCWYSKCWTINRPWFWIADPPLREFCLENIFVSSLQCRWKLYLIKLYLRWDFRCRFRSY